MWCTFEGQLDELTEYCSCFLLINNIKLNEKHSHVLACYKLFNIAIACYQLQIVVIARYQLWCFDNYYQSWFTGFQVKSPRWSFSLAINHPQSCSHHKKTWPKKNYLRIECNFLSYSGMCCFFSDLTNFYPKPKLNFLVLSVCCTISYQTNFTLRQPISRPSPTCF